MLFNHIKSRTCCFIASEWLCLLPAKIETPPAKNLSPWSCPFVFYDQLPLVLLAWTCGIPQNWQFWCNDVCIHIYIYYIHIYILYYIYIYILDICIYIYVQWESMINQWTARVAYFQTRPKSGDVPFRDRRAAGRSVSAKRPKKRQDNFPDRWVYV